MKYATTATAAVGEQTNETNALTGLIMRCIIKYEYYERPFCIKLQDAFGKRVIAVVLCS
jgi:hypothetical protein